MRTDISGSVLVAGMLALLAGCNRVAYVTDAHAHAIPGVAVISQYDNYDLDTVYTDQQGRAVLHDRLFWPPRTLAISKPGYRKQTLDFPAKWPALLVLEKDRDTVPVPTTGPTTRYAVP